jgi:hypothetical protein
VPWHLHNAALFSKIRPLHLLYSSCQSILWSKTCGIQKSTKTTAVWVKWKHVCGDNELPLCKETEFLGGGFEMISFYLFLTLVVGTCIIYPKLKYLKINLRLCTGSVIEYTIRAIMEISKLAWLSNIPK